MSAYVDPTPLDTEYAVAAVNGDTPTPFRAANLETVFGLAPAAAPSYLADALTAATVGEAPLALPTADHELDRVRGYLADLTSRVGTDMTMDEVDSLIGVHNALKAFEDRIHEVRDFARGIAAAMAQASGVTRMVTPSGVIELTSASERVTYDSRRLDSLAASDPAMAAVLSPLRKVTAVSGTVRILAPKGGE